MLDKILLFLIQFHGLHQEILMFQAHQPVQYNLVLRMKPLRGFEPQDYKFHPVEFFQASR